MSAQAVPLLRVSGLSKTFRTAGGGRLRAVDGVDCVLMPGETLGIVGESGCGKSTLARLILRLIEPDSGSVHFDGVEVLALSVNALRAKRRDMQLVFQDPYASLDPRMTVGAIVAEPLVIHRIGTRTERRAKVRALLESVGLSADAAGLYPHEFSGGQRQRIGIARAIALEPKLLVLDEPVSALDVSIRSQILNLLFDLKAKMGLSYIFISHDLAVVQNVSDRVAVMYLGRIVESASVDAIYRNPSHPYTEALLSAVPQPEPGTGRARILLPGDPPNPEAPPRGCPFHPRCPKAMPECSRDVPEEREVGETHWVRCHLYR